MIERRDGREVMKDNKHCIPDVWECEPFFWLEDCKRSYEEVKLRGNEKKTLSQEE